MQLRATLNRIKDVVRQVDPAADVVLFGSRARGDHAASSDWDLLLLPAEPITPVLEQRLRAAVYEVELELEEVFSLFVYPKSSWTEGRSPSPLFENIRQEGITA